MRQVLIFVFLFFFTLSASAQVDLTKARIAVATGTSHDQYVTKHYPGSRIIRVDNHIDLIPLLKADKADYGVVDMSVIKPIIEDHHMVIVDSALFVIPTAIAFRKEDTELRNQFNDFLRQIKKDGTHQQLKNRWMEQQNPVLPDIRTNGKVIRVATCASTFPYAYVKDNQIVGYDIELMLRFGQSKGYEIVFEDMKYMGMIAALLSHKVDVVAAAYNATEERKKQVSFSDPYLEDPSAVFTIDKNVPQRFVMPDVVGGTIEDTIKTIVGQRKIAVVEGTAQDVFLSKTFPSAQVMRVSDHSDSFLMLNSENASYVLCNIGVALEYIKNNPNTEIILSHLLRFNCCYAIGKNNPSLKEELNEFIAKTNTDSLYKYWFENLSDGKMPEIDLSKNTNVLRIGSSASATPFCFIANEEYRGLDFDLLTRFCQATGRRMEVVEMPFNALVASLAAGKVDILANSLVDTEERKKSVDFTIPYARNYSVILRSNQSAEVATKGIWDTFKDTFYNNLIVEKRYILILEGLWETIILSVFSILLGTIIGGVVCYLIMRKNRLLSTSGKVYVHVIRGIPILVLLMMNFYVIFAQLPISATWVAVISFAMNFGAYVSEMFHSSIVSIDKGQREAGIAMGFTSTQTFVHIIAPQAIARVLPVFKGEAISLVKMTSIVGYIAVQDLTKVSDMIRSRTFDAFFPLVLVAIIYFLLALAFTKLIDLIILKYIKK